MTFLPDRALDRLRCITDEPDLASAPSATNLPRERRS